MAQYHCNYCQENIFGLRVKCAECSDFDLCLQCFSCGAEIGCHKRNHEYLIIDCGNFPIFEAPHGWKASEELKLLDAVEQYGFGNWDDISNQIQSREADEAKAHYSTLYIHGNVGKVTWPQQVASRPKDHTCSSDGGPLSPSLCSRLPVLDLTPQEQQELGYMPNRDDFEREYDNEAELVASSLTVSQDDEEIDVALKLAHVDMFSWRLRERLRRKRVARDYNLVSLFYSRVGKGNGKGPNSKKKNSKEDREFQERMKVFSQFHTSQDQEQLFENIQKEKELKSRIKELVRYRRNGLSKLEDCPEFDSARYKREKKNQNKKKSGSSGTVHHRKSSTGSKKQEEKGGVGITSQEEQNGATVDDANANPVSAQTVTAVTTATDEDAAHDDVDIELFSGHEMLSGREKRLCRTLGLRPTTYFTLKTVLLKDHLLRRQGIPVKSFHHHHHAVGLDKIRRRRILSFMVSSGWLATS